MRWSHEVGQTTGRTIKRRQHILGSGKGQLPLMLGTTIGYKLFRPLLHFGCDIWLVYILENGGCQRTILHIRPMVSGQITVLTSLIARRAPTAAIKHATGAAASPNFPGIRGAGARGMRRKDEDRNEAQGGLSCPGDHRRSPCMKLLRWS